MFCSIFLKERKVIEKKCFIKKIHEKIFDNRGTAAILLKHAAVKALPDTQISNWL